MIPDHLGVDDQNHLMPCDEQSGYAEHAAVFFIMSDIWNIYKKYCCIVGLRTSFLSSNARRRTRVYSPEAQPRTEVGVNPLAHIGRIKLEVQIADTADPQLARRPGADVDSAYEELLYRQTRSVLRDVQYSDASVAAPALVDPSVACPAIACR
ncbi:hypothetical protein PG993_000198 [Apiospora rasikravindrae]|uniref:Uncharacterized protein n=1 Tax=Apiospora rasikravindrae TaxID=990691 RepID=A0ABR1U7T7_9PEZI